MAQLPKYLKKQTILVTGGNKGVGLSICKQLHDLGHNVIMGTRDLKNGEKGLKLINKSQDDIDMVELNLTDNDNIKAAVKDIEKKYKSIDILINNAAMAFKGDAFDDEVVKTTFETNYFGTINVTDKFLPLINKGGRIIFVSSRSGSSTLARMSKDKCNAFLNAENVEQLNELYEEFYNDVKKDKDNIKKLGWAKSAYGTSKAAISMYSKLLSEKLKNDYWIAAVCPGNVKTDMSSQNGDRNPDQGAWGISKLATMDISDLKKTPSGKFWAAFYDDILAEKKLDKSEWQDVAEVRMIKWVN